MNPKQKLLTMNPKQKLLTLFVFCVLTLQLFAVPAIPYPITRVQPDGSVVTLYMHGDETVHCMTDKSGWIVKQDIDGFLKYVQQDNTLSNHRVGDVLPNAAVNVKEWMESEVVVSARNNAATAPKRAATYPKKGSPVSLVILVNFADREFVIPNARQEFEKMLNEPGYSENEATGSAYDFFVASSQGQFAPQFDVVGPYTLPGTIEDYGYNNRNGNDSNPRKMITDACKAADEAGVDFTKYDTDSNDVVDNVFVYYAGYNEAEGADANTVWPHRSVVSNSASYDGKTIYDYACTSELKGNRDTIMAAIGTFCHEFGHVLGMPDYYHTQDSEMKTLGYWNTMDRGSYLNESRTPPLYSAYDRFYIGWLTPRELTQPEYLILEPLTQADSIVDTSRQAFLVSAEAHNMDGANPNPREFFIVEYRTKTGWDRFLSAEGVLFWHIDYNSRYWTGNSVNNYRSTHNGATDHMRVYIEPRNANSKIYNPLPYTTGDFDPTLWNGSALGKPFTDINIIDGRVYMTFMGGDSLAAPVIIDSLTVVYNTGLTISWTQVWEEINDVNGYYVVVKDAEGNEVSRTWTTDTTYTIVGLEYDKEYVYTVETAYKNGGYEVRQPSEPRVLTTPKEDKVLEVSYSPIDRLFTIFKDKADEVINVYDMSGRCVQQIGENMNIVHLDVSSYTIGQPLLLRCANKVVKIVIP